MKIKILGIIGFVCILAFAGYYHLTGQSVGQKIASLKPEAASQKELSEAPSNIQLAQAAFTPENLPLALQIQNNDRIIGDPKAPVTVIEYASMTCSHCADFHNKIYPEIKEAFINTGQVKWVLRSLPWDDAAAYISKINRCVPAEQFEAVSSAYFKAQKDWMTAENPLAEVKKIGRLAGLSEEKFDACVADQALTKEVLAMKRVATEVLNVRGTPAFFINGERVEGGRNFTFMKKAIETAYEAATKQQS